MSIFLEHIQADTGSSFRVLHLDVMPTVYEWNYHYHPEIELVFVFDGMGRRHVGNHVSYYDSGDLVLIGSQLPHSGFGYGALEKHREVVVQFKYEIFGNNFMANEEFVDIQLMLERAKYGVAFSKALRDELKPRFERILELAGFERFVEMITLLKILAAVKDYEILNESKVKKEYNLKDSDRISKIINFVEENYQNNINSNDLAGITSLSLPAFCNYFKKHFSASFTDFLNEYRINNATRILLDGKNVTEACFQSGFNSLPYFNRTFKKFKLMSPSVFQNTYYKKRIKR